MDSKEQVDWMKVAEGGGLTPAGAAADRYAESMEGLREALREVIKAAVSDAIREADDDD